jgi:hypothetical protein
MLKDPFGKGLQAVAIASGYLKALYRCQGATCGALIVTSLCSSAGHEQYASQPQLNALLVRVLRADFQSSVGRSAMCMLRGTCGVTVAMNDERRRTKHFRAIRNRKWYLSS